MTQTWTTDQLNAALASNNFVVSRAVGAAGEKIDSALGRIANNPMLAMTGIDASPITNQLGDAAKEQLGSAASTLASSMKDQYPELSEFFKGLDTMFGALFKAIYSALGYTPEQEQMVNANPASVSTGLQSIWRLP